MNALRRKALDAILATLQQAQTDLEGIAQEERDAFDAMPEGLQQTEQGQQSEQAAESLEEHAQTLVELCDNIAEVVQS